jgi:dGTPase
MTKMNWDRLLCAERQVTGSSSSDALSNSSSGDARSQFQRDHDRLIFSTAFRRLQDKTQVFPLDPNDGVRTRLTHSLEVSAVARGLSRKAASWLRETREVSAEQEQMIPDICETAGLAHDLGNPPFGHYGEEVIRGWCSKKIGDEASACPDLCDFKYFQGNVQTVRLLANLPTGTHPKGYNFTAATLSTCCKYTAARETVREKTEQKLGFLASEQEVIKWCREKTGTGDARHPLTYLVEAADDIVYSIADMEDAIRKKHLRFAEVRIALETIKESDGCARGILEMYAHLAARVLDGDESALAACLRTSVIRKLVDAADAEFREQFDLIAKGEFSKELLDCSEGQAVVQKLKDLIKPVLASREVTSLELMGKNVLRELMDVYWEGAVLQIDGKDGCKKAAQLLSPNYVRIAKENGKLCPTYRKLQLVVDQVSGMTDTFAKRTHAELFNAR